MLKLKTRTSHRPNKFVPEEDERLKAIIAQYGPHNWVTIASMMPGRNVRQCIERWKHYNAAKNPGREWTEEEDRILLEKFKIFGRKWIKIVPFLTDRNVASIRNRFYQLCPKEKVKKVEQVSIKPDKPEIDAIDKIFSSMGSDKNESKLELSWTQSSDIFQLM
ncbi:Myb-like DNA-binding domain containing protein [Trichomonas vaginalis G3]|uniref:Myb-like DNA-binding domain containing protein n=1 Tax=Trichomonas vaginalis (strain ATCC PRA-98 / G3) TaxID=412133 RepID=A2G4F8_TRIV3|nr:RNA polymerase II transcription regulator recruiting protein [Trichomonas vaginalis G3]EAX87961.1 Myb-like DNA-binding domain containing protein [Trichomonas vaginalis G3]KAI5542468.1 RNA polymerase II transcription regulator recruiting protein [Trichomonas vaginalis G3]|eukprot:XP_001300891.1 Myb-like DNA-binding domain containing protein [Trichomonas vaginalis G3]